MVVEAEVDDEIEVEEAAVAARLRDSSSSSLSSSFTSILLAFLLSISFEPLTLYSAQVCVCCCPLHSWIVCDTDGFRLDIREEQNIKFKKLNWNIKHNARD